MDELHAVEVQVSCSEAPNGRNLEIRILTQLYKFRGRRIRTDDHPVGQRGGTGHISYPVAAVSEDVRAPVGADTAVGTVSVQVCAAESGTQLEHRYQSAAGYIADSQNESSSGQTTCGQ
jgi:hypothetical protein